MVWRSGIQKDADGFLRLSAENDDARVDFAGLARNAINIKDAAGAIAIVIHQNFVRHGIGNERAIAGGDGVCHGGKGGIEIRMRHAAAFARSAEVARAAPIGGPGKVRGTGGHNGAAELFLDTIPEQSLLASERNRRLELAVGKMFKAFRAAGDADIFLDELVIRRNVLLAARLFLTIANDLSVLKIQIAQT